MNSDEINRLKNEAITWELTCDVKNTEIAELKDMLWEAWEAVGEAGYEGYNVKLAKFMENLDE